MVMTVYDPPNRLYQNKAGKIDQVSFSFFLPGHVRVNGLPQWLQPMAPGDPPFWEAEGFFLYRSPSQEFYDVLDKMDAMILAFDVTDKSAFKKPIWTESYLDEWKEKKGDAPVVWTTESFCCPLVALLVCCAHLSNFFIW